MRGNVYFYFMHTHVFIILSLVFLWFNATSATSFGHQQLLAAAAEGGAKTCIDKERQALLDLKAHLLDPNDELSTWRPEEEADCCRWEGVTCNYQTGHVIALSLFRLEGEITDSLLNLTYLDQLILTENSFHGTIHKFICSMTHLTSLRLYENQFTDGTIPDCIGNITQLTDLHIVGNSLSGVIPKFICSMTHLTYLDFSQNQFTAGTIPHCIGNITQLTFLSLGSNNFSGFIPRSIGSLSQLKYLELSYNSFFGTIPTELGNLTNLDSLSLDSVGSCTFKNLDWLSSLSSLSVLSMDGISLAKENNWVNVIIGLHISYLSLRGCDLSQVMHPYSSSINSSSSINTLYLDNNNLNVSMNRWLCPVFGDELDTLSLSGNKFDWKLSHFLNNLAGCTSSTSFLSLDVSSNQFTGSLSDEIQNFSSLTYLNLSSNELDGTISDKLWQLPILQILDLSSNSLKGAIFENIGSPYLMYIDLSYNSLEAVPFNDDVSILSANIKYIDFSSNKLGPRFPKWIQKVKSLTHLDLSNNSIADTVSTEYWNQWKSSQLSYLDLSFNNISGKLPKSLSNHNLSFIDLSFNCFYGPIPAFPADISFLDLSRNIYNGGISSLCHMYTKLEFLDLSRNMITGKLPDCCRNLPYLRFLNLGYNSLSGNIPPSLGYLGQLETLCLYNNSFSRELPLSLKNCTSLSLLDLGVNKLYGSIPVWIGENLSRLYALSLISNNFFGTIPSQICQLVSLQIIDLSFNNLNGTIASCMNNLTSMVKKGPALNQNVHHYHSSGERPTYTKLNTYSTEFDNSYTDHMMIEWQGKINEFSSNLGFVKCIDLSSNSLTGQIPYNISNLQGLVVLNLSHNTLLGEIPKDIGQMKELITLDLSSNNLSGGLPLSMSQMHFLSYLDVSHNNLSGRIPSGPQFDTSEPSRYIGNAGLCAPPLTKYCPGDKSLEITPVIGERKSDDDEAIDELHIWFYIGGTAGFATGFGIVCSALLLNRRGRRAFFHFHDSVKDWLYVTVAVFTAKWRRDARA